MKGLKGIIVIATLAAAAAVLGACEKGYKDMPMKFGAAGASVARAAA